MTNPPGPPRPPAGGHGQTAPSLSPDAGAEGTIRLEAVAPPGDKGPLRYRVTFRNNKDTPLDNVRIWHTIPEGVGLLEADPPPELRDGRLCWDLGTLPPGAQQPVAVLVLPPGAEWLPPEQAVFHTSFTTNGVLRVVIRRPALDIRILGPSRVRAGANAGFTFETENIGTGEATGVTLQVRLPAGLRHADGSTVTIPLGNLAARALVRCRLDLLATESGAQRIEAVALTGEHQKTAEAEVTVLPPMLRVLLSGPNRWGVGELAELSVAVVSAAETDLGAVEIECTLPDGFEPLPDVADEWEAEEDRVRWRLPGLAAGAAERRALRVVPRLPGPFRLSAVARAGRTEAVQGLDGAVEITQPARLLDDILAAIDAADAPARASPAMRTADVADDLRFVVFRLGGEEFALPLASVQEISRPLSVTPVPNTPDWVLGVANVRGDIVSMVDLRAFLGLDESGSCPGGRMLVARARAEEMVVGLIVDEVIGIRPVPPELVKAPASPLEGRLVAYLNGVAHVGGRLVVLLDAERLLLSPELRQLEVV